MPQKLLIVEDEPNIVMPLQFLLEKKGYQISAAGSGEEALEKIAQVKPDLILLDIMLPGMDGYDVCQLVRQNPDTQNIKIVFLSAMGRDVDIARGSASTADGHIVKPFSILEVTAKVAALLEDRRT